MTLPDLSWQEQAECRRHPKWMFFSDATIDLAKRICDRCPVEDQCLRYALATNQEGVWGGTSDKERRGKPARRVRRKRAS
jgi:WhiB family redox-sensing transcriptional regulator